MNKKCQECNNDVCSESSSFILHSILCPECYISFLFYAEELTKKEGHSFRNLAKNWSEWNKTNSAPANYAEEARTRLKRLRSNK